MPARSHRTPQWWGAVALVAGIMLLVGIGQASLGHKILEKAGLYQEPVIYTSLAFEHPDSLPEQLRSKQQRVDISFVIHNVGAPNHIYQWTMQLTQSRHTRRIVAGHISVESGESVEVTQLAKISCAQGQVRIAVSLAHPSESIYSWMACPSPKGGAK